MKENVSMEDLVEEAHAYVDEVRRRANLAPVQWPKRRLNMETAVPPSIITETCELCSTHGFKNIKAHYKSVPAGKTHNGKRKPAMCYDHAHGITPSYIRTQKADPVTWVTYTPGEHLLLKELEKENNETLSRDENRIDRLETKLDLKEESTSDVSSSDVTVKQTKWGRVIHQVTSIKIGQSIAVDMPSGGTVSQLRSTLYQNPKTEDFVWSVTGTGSKVSVACVGQKKWPPIIADKITQRAQPTDSVEEEDKMVDELVEDFNNETKKQYTVPSTSNSSNGPEVRIQDRDLQIQKLDDLVKDPYDIVISDLKQQFNTLQQLIEFLEKEKNRKGRR